MQTAEQFERQRVEDKRVFGVWLNGLTYNQAEYFFRRGVLSEDGWDCYRVLWALSAPRFSHLADYGRNLLRAAYAQTYPERGL